LIPLINVIFINNSSNLEIDFKKTSKKKKDVILVKSLQRNKFTIIDSNVYKEQTYL